MGTQPTGGREKEHNQTRKSCPLNKDNIDYCKESVSSISKMVENYRNMEKSIVAQLLLETPAHHPTTGAYRENVWKSLFEMVVPRKFCIEQNVFIIDSFGYISKEVDLAIFDETYTPYIFNYGKIKFIPIEAVAVAVQCKSDTIDTKIEKNLKEWVCSINLLKPSLNSVLRVMKEIVDNNTCTVVKNEYIKQTQTATKPILIFCSTNKGEIGKNILELFDIILNIEGDQLKKTLPKEDVDYKDWYEQLNHYQLERYGLGQEFYKNVKKKVNNLDRKLSQLEVTSHGTKNVIMSLNFQLNQMLMLINNPMQFPHAAYVDMFNKEASALLAIYDITGIQEYIFATRWLSENAGASLIVTRMLTEELPRVIMEVSKRKAITAWDSTEPFQMTKDPELLAEIIYIGGGNAVVAYRNCDVYDEVNKKFAKILLEQSYTLGLATAAKKTTFQTYGEDKKDLDRKLKRVKSEMLRQRPLGALPVVEQEAFHGLPITQVLDDQKISTLQMLKRQAYKAYDRKPLIYRRELPDKNTVFAVEMKDLIEQEGENAYIAVVHIDGNGMGNAIRGLVEDLRDYQDAIPKMRKLSSKISQTYQKVFAQLLGALHAEERYKKEKAKQQLPIRPLIMDGDDITFICKGALGVPLAAMFLRILAKQSEEDFSLSACAGIALVHHNFPFDIAYEIAEECCQNAKKRRLERKDSAGYLDFHVVEGAYVQALRDLREQEDACAAEDRRMNRPYRVEASFNMEPYNSFDRLHKSIKRVFAAEAGTDKPWPKYRLKKLHEAYLQGELAVQALQAEFDSRGYRLSVLEGELQQEQGNSRQRIFDALELIELYDAEFVDLFVDSNKREETR